MFVFLQESESDANKQQDSVSEDEPLTPRIPSTSHHPKYQLFLNNDIKTNGLGGREADGPSGGGSVLENGPKPSRWESTRLGSTHLRGSLESLSSRDWDTVSDRVRQTLTNVALCWPAPRLSHDQNVVFVLAGGRC